MTHDGDNHLQVLVVVDGLACWVNKRGKAIMTRRCILLRCKRVLLRLYDGFTVALGQLGHSLTLRQLWVKRELEAGHHWPSPI